jgi:ribose/xylose/arabinose/galactoside ABC-type transport system permease subunit/ABC-type sugar transport system substrate-binding protein
MQTSLRTNLSQRFSISGTQRILLLAFLAEVILFAFSAPAFFTWTNFFELLRFSVELGLLAVALTPILIVGGIDLSVGSTVGLIAIVFGTFWHDLHLSVPAAIALSLVASIACGALNALLIANLRLPPLIITLGTYSLYRGIAEGITHGAVSFTGYPHGFLMLGQGYLWNMIPVQLTILIAIATCYAILLHRSTIGRALYAIGFNAEGARYAGLPVRRRVALIYILSGAVSGVAALLYVAHLGLAKSDLGTGFELQAITAVVIGGTSVFGGRGNLFGTLLGLFFLSTLQNGLHLLAVPSEASGVLTGVLLLLVVSIDLIWKRQTRAEGGRAVGRGRIAFVYGMLAVVAVAGLAFGLKHRSAAGSADTNGGHGHRPVIAVMPKAKGDPYFVSARVGAEQAAKELGVDLIWDGPTSLDASQQNELVENWITRGVDAIVVAVENKGSISTVLRKARAHGIAVLTWDADAETDARDYFLNQATPKAIADALTDEAARLMPEGGEFAIITGALSAENQNEWIRYIKARVAEKHPQLKLAAVLPSDDDRDKAFAQTQTILKVYPQVKLVMAISAPAVPGAAEAVQQSGRSVDVIGLSLPSICRSHIHSGVVQTIVLWNTTDLGYLTVYGGWLDSQKKIAKDATSVVAGRLGKLDVQGEQGSREIILGRPLIIDKKNVDALNF